MNQIVSEIDQKMTQLQQRMRKDDKETTKSGI